jgi:hypothetical protein
MEQAARVFTEEDVLSALDLAGLQEFKDAVAVKLFEYEEIKLANIASVISAISMPGQEALRFKKLLTDSAAREATIKERLEHERQRPEAEEKRDDVARFEVGFVFGFRFLPVSCSMWCAFFDGCRH